MSHVRDSPIRDRIREVLATRARAEDYSSVLYSACLF